jgi:YkoY family integral membrane protein
MDEFFIKFFGDDFATSGLIILDLFIIESLLSVDNAAVLATMVMDLPRKLRNKALQYGILGAYVFRGLCLFFATYLVKFLWLKAIGGAYLLWITYSHFKNKNAQATNSVEEEDISKINKRENWLFKITKGTLGIFWSTVVLVEVMDLAFSIDNIFAAVAITENVYLICIGVFVGILAMRLVAQSFVRLMEKYTFLENMAFSVIGILGFKLFLSSFIDYFGSKEMALIFNGHKADLIFSLITAGFFFIPLLSSFLFNFPQRHEVEN